MSGRVFTTSECASASLVNVRVVRFLQHWNVRVLVWSMCEWSGFYSIGMCECYSLVNVRVVEFLQHRNVRVLVWSMCEWSGCDVRMEMCV